MNNKRKYILWGLFVGAFAIFLYFFNTTLKYNKPEDYQEGIVYEKAEVTSIISEDIDKDPDFDYINIGIQDLELKILTGENKGKIIIANNYIGRIDNKPAEVGTKFIVSSFDDFSTSLIVNYSREISIYILVFIFVGIVIIFGGIKGIKSIFSLVFTIAIIIFLFIPLIIRGVNPIIASIIIVMLATIVTMVALNGVCKKTIVAASSCILCTLLAGLIMYIFGEVNNISTLNTAEAEDLLFVASKTSLRVKELLFAGILISSLGAIMDTSMSITSSIFEIHELNPNLSISKLLKSGMNVGRDIMGTMTNTLILAFTGSSINILIIYYMYQYQYLYLMNIDMIVIEILQGLSGGIAVVASIPITAIVATRVISYRKNVKGEIIK